ncbi:MAG: hypothetical protein WCX71_04130 [Candidatus Buchananbacteria bacterium]
MFYFFAAILAFIFLLLITYALGGWLAAPWVPTWQNDVKQMLQLAEIKPGEIVMDLGAGDARIMTLAVKNYQAQAVGYEIAVLPYLLGWFRIILLGLAGRVQLKYGNFFKADISQADVICIFLMPAVMIKIKNKIDQEAKPGCRILSYAFKISDWEPKAIFKPKKNQIPIYLYQK